MESQTFDLLPDGRKNAIFRVSFDFYTPRAHFVILPKSDKTIEPEFSRMTSEQVCELIEGSQDDAIDFGWKSRNFVDSPRFVDIDKGYIFSPSLCGRRELLGRIQAPKRRDSQLAKFGYVTKQWKADKDPCSYAKNVRGYPYRSYLSEEVAQITSTQPLVYDSRKNATRHSGINVVYHSSHPKIGFLGSDVKNTEYLKEVLLVMEKYANQHGLTDCASRNDNNGCHLCVYLGSCMLGAYFGEVQEWYLSRNDVASSCNVVGYIVTTGARFYDLCPPKQRQSCSKLLRIPSSHVLREGSVAMQDNCF